MYQLIKDGESLPFNLSIRSSATYYLEEEKKKGMIRLMMSSFTDIEAAAIASKCFEDLGKIDLTTYSSLTLALAVGDNTDTALTLAVGARILIAKQWSVFAELDLGDRDGWGIGGAFSF